MGESPKRKHSSSNANRSHSEYTYPRTINIPSLVADDRSSHPRTSISPYVAGYSTDTGSRLSASSLPDQNKEYPHPSHMMDAEHRYDYRRRPKTSMTKGDSTFPSIPSSPSYPSRCMDPPLSPVFSPFKSARTLRRGSEDAASSPESTHNSFDQSEFHRSSGHARRRSESDAPKPAYRRNAEAAIHSVGYEVSSRKSLVHPTAVLSSSYSDATSNRRDQNAGHQKSLSAGSCGFSPRRHDHGLRLEDDCRRLPPVDFPRPYSPRPSHTSDTATPTRDNGACVRANSTTSSRWHVVEVPTVDGRLKKVKVREL